MRTHLDLFSGIGGFALAANWAGYQTVGFCEIEDYPRRILSKRFPGVPCHRDIRELDGSIYRGVDLITGGYPCQPFSQAGQRKGKEDDRHLWPELRRVVAQARPAFLVAENVAGHITLGLDEVLADLESEGYAGRAIVVPACAVNAPHRRERVWIIAHSEIERIQGLWSSGFKEPPAYAGQEVPLCGHERIGSSYWETEPAVGRVADGLPSRVDRLKGLGNAIVPQVAYEIIKELERHE